MSNGNAKKFKLMKAFHLAKSCKEMLKSFKKLENKFDEKELGMECLRFTLRLYKEGADPETIPCFRKRALKSRIDTEDQYSRHCKFLIFFFDRERSFPH